MRFYENGTFVTIDDIFGTWDVSGDEITLEVDGERETYKFGVGGGSLSFLILHEDERIVVWYTKKSD